MDPPRARSVGTRSPVADRPVASAPPSASPSAPPSPAPTSAPSATASAPPDPQKLLWYDTASGGDVLPLLHPSGFAVVPAFLGATIEGTTAAVLDPAGLPRWERRYDGVGAQDAAVGLDGSIVTIAVDLLDWPKTAEAYEKRRILTIAADGKSERSFRLPAGVEALSIDVEANGKLLVAGQFTGDRTLARGVRLHADGEGALGFVAGITASGTVEWARAFQGEVGAEPVTPGKVLFLVSLPGATPSQKLLLGDGTGHDDWTLDIPSSCRVESMHAVAGVGIHVVAPEGCFEAAPPPPPKERRCTLFRLDPATGRKTASVAVPQCDVLTDAQGIASISEDRRLTLQDLSGKTLWETPLALPVQCQVYGLQRVAAVMDASSIYVTGGCEGARIGTMFNSPYSRAYDRSTTCLERYDRR